MFPYLVRRSWNLLFRRVYECSKKQESTVLRVLNLLVPVCLYIFSNGIQSFTNGSRIAKSHAAWSYLSCDHQQVRGRDPQMYISIEHLLDQAIAFAEVLNNSRVDSNLIKVKLHPVFLGFESKNELASKPLLLNT